MTSGRLTPAKRVIEYIIAAEGTHPLIHMTLTQFADTTASEAPAPGGGSIAAYAGALGAALATMVANLSAHKRGWDDRWEEFSAHAEKGLDFQNQLLRLVDKDTQAFDGIMAAYGMPNGYRGSKGQATTSHPGRHAQRHRHPDAGGAARPRRLGPRD